MDSSTISEGEDLHLSTTADEMHSEEDDTRLHKSPPRQPRNHRPTPSRSPSPPPPPLPTAPSPEYLETASENPCALSQSELPRRKLLVLDLNGALLVRSAKGTPFPRPFMPNFRDYLFHEKTRSWLDVMVWSSAQPHNVDKMVRRCFFSSESSSYGVEPGDEWEGKLVAVWARNTLGLSSQAYFRKTQTTKDLAKPWSQLPNQFHSARTTILLDDSPLKARLQPYNHLCIPEYNGRVRENDLQVKSAINDCSALLNKPDTSLDETSELKFSDTESNSVVTDRERRRKEKKQRKKLNKRAAAIHDRLRQEDFDETLMAVIGILDEVKEQENVAAWIKHGGLWAGHPPPLERLPSADNAEHPNRSPSPTDAEVDDEGPQLLPPPSSQLTMTPSQPSSPPSSPSAKSELSARVPKRLRSVGTEDRTDGAKRGRSTLEEAGEPGFALGNDAESNVAPSEMREDFAEPTKVQQEDALLVPELEKSATQASVPEKYNLWFEHPDVLRYWVTRGRYALREFKILEDDGVEVDPAHLAETFKH